MEKLMVALALVWAASASAARDAATTPTKECGDIRRDARFALHFPKVELAELVQTVADATCKTFILPEKVSGRISLIGPEKGSQTLTADQLYAAFLSALDVHGLAVQRSGRFLRIVEKARAKQGSIPMTFEPDEPYTLNDQMVTHVRRVKHLELDVVGALLKGFLSHGAELTPVPPDLLIISELGSNLHRVEKLVDALDVPAPPREVLRAFPVRHAAAQEVADKLQRMFPGKQGPKAGSELAAVVADERTNQVLVLAASASLERVQELISLLDEEVPGDGEIRVYHLQNADAKELAGNLDALVQGTRVGKAGVGGPGSAGGAPFSGEVKVTANESNNSLLIVASPADYRSLLKVIAELDVAPRQVLIETVIMEVNLDRDRQVGASGHLAPSGRLPVLLASQPEEAPSSVSLGSLASAAGLLVGLQGPALAQLSTTLGLKLPHFGLAFSALQLSSDVNVVSTPYILVTDNKEAEINVGQKVPFQTGGLNSDQLRQLLQSGNQQALSTLSLTPQVARERVELKLSVKPHIGEGDNVRLELDQQMEEIAGENRFGQITSSRGEKTTVVAQDGETVVLGGIMIDRTIERASKTPILGDIPLLGHLFRYSAKHQVKTNLLIFLTPHVIKGPADFRRILDAKLRQRREFVEQFYGELPAELQTVDFSRKPGPLAAMFRAIRREENRPENGGPGNLGERVIGPDL